MAAETNCVFSKPKTIPDSLDGFRSKSLQTTNGSAVCFHAKELVAAADKAGPGDVQVEELQLLRGLRWQQLGLPFFMPALWHILHAFGVVKGPINRVFYNIVLFPESRAVCL